MPQQQTEEELRRAEDAALAALGGTIEIPTIPDKSGALSGFEQTPGIPLLTRAPATPQPPQPRPDVGRFQGEDWLGRQVLSGLGTAAEGTHKLIGNAAGLIDNAFNKISESTGIPKNIIMQVMPTLYPDQFKDISKFSQGQVGEQRQFAEEMAGGRQDIPSQTVRAITAGVGSLPTLTAATALGGPVGGFAALGALETFDPNKAARDQDWGSIIKAGIEGALMGKFLHVLGPFKRPIRMPAAATVEYAKLRLKGVDHETALSNAMGLGFFTGMGGPGEKGFRDVPGAVREVGQEIRNIPSAVQQRMPGLPQVKNVLSPEARRNQQFFTEHEIDTPLSMQTGSLAAGGLEGTVQSMPGGGGFTEKMQASKEKLTGPVAQEIFGQIYPERVTPEEVGTAVQQTIGKGLEETRAGLAEEVLPGQPQTPGTAGEALLGRGKQEIKQFHQASNEAYEAARRAEQHPGNTEVVPKFDDNGRPVLDEQGNQLSERMALPLDLADIQEKLKPLADRYERTLADTDVRASLGLKTMRDMIKRGRYVDVFTAELDRGMLLDALRKEPGMAELRGTSGGLIAKTVAELTQAIDAKMAQAKYPGWDGTGESPALRHLKSGRLNTAKKYEVEDLFGPYGKDIEKVEPVRLSEQITAGRDVSLEQLRRMAERFPEQMPHFGRAFIENGGNWEGLGPETKKILFKDPGIIKGLDEYYAKHAKFGPLLKLEPVALFDRMTARGGKHINLTQEIAAETPEHKAQILRALVEGLLERATREGDIQKVQGTLDKWMDMDEKTKATLSEDPKTIQNLNELFFGMKRMMQTANPSRTGFVNALNQFKGNIFKGLGMMLGGAAGGYGGHGYEGAGIGTGAGYLAGGVAEYGANAALAHLLFNQKFINMLNRGIKAELQGDNASGRLAARTLSKIIEENPPEGPQEPPEGPGTPPVNPPGGGEGPPPPPPGAPPAGEPGLGQRIKEGLKEFWQSEEGTMTLPPGGGREADYTKHLSPPAGEPVSPLKPLQPPEIRRGGKLEGSLHYLRRAAERRPGVGGPDNERIVFRDKDGEFVVGKLTAEDWVKRASKLTPEEMVKSRRWYRELEAFFEQEFGEKEGPKLMMAWLSSQQNVSPSGGMMNVLRAQDLLRGMPKEKVAGLAEEKILAALEGKIPAEGYDAKLMDFVDSALGKSTRTFMGDDPRGGQPSVIDVWANRDIGKIDQKVLDYLTERFGARAVKNLKLDGASIGETDYEYGSRFYNRLVETLNKSGYDGGGWTGPQVQAVGWVGMQKAMGATPEFASDLISKNTRRYAFEVEPGGGAPILQQYPWHTLSPEQQTKVTEHVGTRVTDLAAEVTGARITNRVVTRGAYQGKPTISVQMDVFASPETFRDFARASAYLGQQSEVWYVRPLASGKNWAYSIRGKGLETPEAQQTFWSKLRDKAGPELVPGYSPLAGEMGAQAGGDNGLFIVNPFSKQYLFQRSKAGFKNPTTMRYWTAKEKAKIDAAINEVEAEMGLDLYVDFGKVDLGASLHNWARKGKKNGHLQGLVETGRSNTAARLLDLSPESLRSWKEAWDQATGAGRAKGPTRKGK